MNRFLQCGGFCGRSWESDSIRIFNQTVSRETIECLPNVQGICRMKNRLGHLCGAQKQKVFWSSNFSKMLARFRASSPDRCPQAAKSLCHAFGTRSGWWEKRQLFEAGRTRPPHLVKPEQKTSILQLFQWNSCNGNALQKILLLEKTIFNVRQKGVPPLLLPAAHITNFYFFDRL